MANGTRCAPMRHVSEAEELRIRKDADDLKIPQDVLRFNTGMQTSFDVRGWINIRGVHISRKKKKKNQKAY